MFVCVCFHRFNGEKEFISSYILCIDNIESRVDWNRPHLVIPNEYINVTAASEVKFLARHAWEKCINLGFISWPRILEFFQRLTGLLREVFISLIEVSIQVVWFHFCCIQLILFYIFLPFFFIIFWTTLQFFVTTC